jgi:hypothetical protein
MIYLSKSQIDDNDQSESSRVFPRLKIHFFFFSLASIGLVRPADDQAIMAIYQSIIRLERPDRKQVIMQRIWLLKCLQLYLDYLMIQAWHGIRDKNNGSLSGKIYRTQCFKQSAEGGKDGLWATVLSGAVLIH